VAHSRKNAAFTVSAAKTAEPPAKAAANVRPAAVIFVFFILISLFGWS
jgi:hypothetical protein